MSGFIAVHCGAGYHKPEFQPKYKNLCKKACRLAATILNAGGTALDACQAAVMILEADPITNSGYGSNLTITGTVECDASIMDGKSLNFGACGAVKGIKYPISLATQICKDQSIERPLGLIPPMLLAGEGAKQYAEQSKLILVPDEELISRKAQIRYKRNMVLLKKHSINKNETVERLDTVGAVCVDQMGQVAAASSSGGIFLKHDGRIGQAATYASGVWADSSNKTENSIAVTTTGTGEYLVKTLLAKELATNIRNNTSPVTAFYKTFRDNFIDSKYLQNIEEKLGGALALIVTPSGHGELIWGHTTKTMGFAYFDISKSKPTGIISRLQTESEGLSVVVSGAGFKINVP